MQLSNQALGAIMMALQESLMTQNDIVPVLQGFELEETNEGLIVKNPPTVRVPNDEPATKEDLENLARQMPRYRYQCNECQEIITVFHGIEEGYEDCNKCEQKHTMKKLLSTPFIIKRENAVDVDRPVGEITHEYIDINREILEKQKEEARKKTHEPT